jgi:hypothetical protein
MIGCGGRRVRSGSRLSLDLILLVRAIRRSLDVLVHCLLPRHFALPLSPSFLYISSHHTPHDRRRRPNYPTQPLPRPPQRRRHRRHTPRSSINTTAGLTPITRLNTQTRHQVADILRFRFPRQFLLRRICCSSCSNGRRSIPYRHLVRGPRCKHRTLRPRLRCRRRRCRSLERRSSRLERRSLLQRTLLLLPHLLLPRTYLPNRQLARKVKRAVPHLQVLLRRRVATRDRCRAATFGWGGRVSACC